MVDKSEHSSSKDYWQECICNETGQRYWWNQKTNESTWIHPDQSGVDEFSKSSLQIPPTVPRSWTGPSMQIVFHGHPSPSKFLQIYVLECENIRRQAVTIHTENEDENWKTKLLFFAFESLMPSTVEYELAYTDDQYRTRLTSSKCGQKARCDQTKWYPFQDNYTMSRFYTYPMKVRDCTQFHVDFEVNPDRYFIETSEKVEWKKHRCFSFSAYKGAKFHVLECKEPESYKIIEGFSIKRKDELGNNYNDALKWKCILAFYAFKDRAPGSQEYFIQESFEPHYRIRINMTKQQKQGWKDLTSFWAWDLAMPETAKYAIQYKTPDVSEDRSSSEQSRIFISDCWGRWEHKLYFYAYPSKVVL